MKRIVAGILAHVDAGKTTLSEALLYATGQVRKLGRVDHGDAFLDTDAMERQRGITIFTEPAVIATPDLTITLLDTPGHVDFSAETERTLAVLDYAVLVISGADASKAIPKRCGDCSIAIRCPHSSSSTKWTRPAPTKRNCSPNSRNASRTAASTSPSRLTANAWRRSPCKTKRPWTRISTPNRAGRNHSRHDRRRELFPCYFGSALKMDGIEQFVAGFERFAQEPQYNGEFGARIYKVSHDAQGNRLTWLKVTGGELKAKMMLSGTAHAGDADAVAEDGQWHEKADQVRV